MARYVIDAPTLLHLFDNDLAVDPSHQLVAPTSIRSEALQRCWSTFVEVLAPIVPRWKLTSG